MRVSVTVGKANQSTKNNMYHNAREAKHQPHYLLSDDNTLFGDGRAKVTLNAKKAVNKLDRLFDQRAKIYHERMGRKIPSNTQKQLSIVVGISDYHDKVAGERGLYDAYNHVVQTLGADNVVQGAIHYDEGYIDDHGQAHHNLHAHIELCNLDAEGRSIKTRLNRQYLRELQQSTATAAGAEYRPFTSQTRRKNIPHAEYRRIAEAERAAQKELKTERDKSAKLSADLANERSKTNELASDYNKRIDDIQATVNEYVQQIKSDLIATQRAKKGDYQTLAAYKKYVQQQCPDTTNAEVLDAHLSAYLKQHGAVSNAFAKVLNNAKKTKFKKNELIVKKEDLEDLEYTFEMALDGYYNLTPINVNYTPKTIDLSGLKRLDNKDKKAKDDIIQDLESKIKYLQYDIIAPDYQKLEKQDQQIQQQQQQIIQLQEQIRQQQQQIKQMQREYEQLERDNEQLRSAQRDVVKAITAAPGNQITCTPRYFSERFAVYPRARGCKIYSDRHGVNIDIDAQDNQISLRSDTTRESVKLMIDLAESNGYNLGTLKITGDQEFREMAHAEVQTRLDNRRDWQPPSPNGPSMGM